MITLLEYLIPVFHILGIGAALHALMYARTSQGAIAWGVSLVTFPYLALPLYVVLGRSKFRGYLKSSRTILKIQEPVVKAVREGFQSVSTPLRATPSDLEMGFESLSELPFTRGNSAQLLINGKATFDAIFEAIEQAQDYILIEFYIVRDDSLGQLLKQHLLKKLSQGVRIYFLYDAVGSAALSDEFEQELLSAGAEMHAFRTNKGSLLPYQLNFRNHKKIVVVDGNTAFVGGHNIGREYLGEDPDIGPWRDTHVKLQGPVVQSIQAIFVSDWLWVTDKHPLLHWKSTPAPTSDLRMLTIATGPADEVEKATLFFLQAIQSAKQRFWISSPYFVPDATISNALQLAALKGIDVRVMLPAKPDHLLVYLAAFSYLSAAEQTGIKFYRYTSGFLHQKAFLLDDHIAYIGTANLDNRSLRLNFEMGTLISDKTFSLEVARMFEQDFMHSRPVVVDEYEGKWIGFRLAVKFARLLSPIL